MSREDLISHRTLSRDVGEIRAVYKEMYETVVYMNVVYSLRFPIRTGSVGYEEDHDEYAISRIIYQCRKVGR